MRRLIVAATALVVLAGINYTIFQREALLEHGRVVMLELAPVDPRSLMQGDYMALRFKVENDAFPRGSFAGIQDGKLVLALDERGVASYRRLASGAPPAAKEALMRYRIRNDRPKFATDAFFFQEGRGRDYQSARYGEFRVSRDGEAILVALRDDKLKVLGSGRRN